MIDRIGEEKIVRILFVVKQYLPKPIPPSLCVMNVQRALINMGIESDTIMLGDDDGFYCRTEYGNVYSIKGTISFEKKRNGIISYWRVHLPMIFTWPIPSMKTVDAYKKMIRELDEANHYDAIVGTLCPVDVCAACSAFDHFYLYELDSLINNPMYKEGIKKYFTNRLVRWEKRLFDKAECIIHLNNNRNFYAKDQYAKYADKSCFTDVPNLIKGNTSESNFDLNVPADGVVRMVYSGALSQSFRSPESLIRIIEELSKSMKIECLFFSRGDCEDILRAAEKRSDGVIKRMGYVSQEELAQYTERADFLLSIGNRLEGEDYSLPSKVICYISTGKPIIHINGTNDSAIVYLEQYGLSLNVDTDQPLEETCAQIARFIGESKGKRIPFEKAKKLFPQNTPEYTANLIAERIKRRGKNATN